MHQVSPLTSRHKLHLSGAVPRKGCPIRKKPEKVWVAATPCSSEVQSLGRNACRGGIWHLDNWQFVLSDEQKAEPGKSNKLDSNRREQMDFGSSLETASCAVRTRCQCVFVEYLAMPKPHSRLQERDCLKKFDTTNLLPYLVSVVDIEIQSFILNKKWCQRYT